MSACPCRGCRSAPERPGFEHIGVGMWLGQGAGYVLLWRRDGWEPLEPDGASLVHGRPLPKTMDEANALATRHARESGHDHP